jgi:GDP-L-fucose synthase
MFDLAGRRVWVAGHRGMVGGAIARRLAVENCHVLTVGRESLDLTEQSAVRRWVDAQRPDVVVIAAARVGGILANSRQAADFLYENLMIEANIVEAAFRSGVGKLLMLGSSCIYPRLAPQPLLESALLTGPLEPTNQWYAIAKIAGIMLARAYREQHGCDCISAMPTNLYGPGDNFDLTTSHVLPALIRKAEMSARTGEDLVIWGSGKPRREFLHVDDCADACVFLLKHYSGEEHVNVGAGSEITIRDLAKMIATIVGYDGPISTDPAKPDGTPRKLMDVSRLTALGWTATISLEQGIRSTYDWYRQHGVCV